MADTSVMVSSIGLEIEHIEVWKKTGISPPHLTISAVFDQKILEYLSIIPINSEKTGYLVAYFENIFHDHIWQQSFECPQIIFFDDIVTHEILVSLHKYLRRQCADIENIFVVITSNIFVPIWWKDWCNVHREKSFGVIDWPENKPMPWKRRYAPDQDPQWLDLFQEKQKSISRLFTFYGGTYVTLSRCWATLRMCELRNSGYVDFVGGKFPSRGDIIDHTEQITYFKDQSEVDLMAKLYDQWIDNEGRFCRDSSCYGQPFFDMSGDPGHQIELDGKELYQERIDHQHLQWHLDRQCFFSVVRETEDDQCFASISEKTIRSFCHFNVPLHLGPNIWNYLQDLGFWLPNDIVDFGYQNHLIYHDRVKSVLQILREYQNRLPFLKDYFARNQDKFIANGQLAISLLYRS